jgi:hypothetical protein
MTSLILTNDLTFALFSVSIQYFSIEDVGIFSLHRNGRLSLNQSLDMAEERVFPIILLKGYKHLVSLQFLTKKTLQPQEEVKITTI